MSTPIVCSHCRTKVAEVEERVLVIRVKHHGETHETHIPLNRVADRGIPIREGPSQPRPQLT